MRSWRFSKPKTPGFGLSAAYYLSILCPAKVLPPLLTIVNPGGEGGAVVGFGAPLTSGATKDALIEPMNRGSYAIATKDRRTVLQMFVLTTIEAGFDPETFMRSRLALEVPPELVDRMRRSVFLCQIKFESHDPMVYSALDFMLDIAERIGNLTDGVVADPHSERYLLPNGLRHLPKIDGPIDARDHVAVRLRATQTGVHAYTRGMSKFNLPEFEINGLRDGVETAAARVLLEACQSALLGAPIKERDRVGPFTAASGGFDQAFWQGADVYELRPPTSVDPTDALLST